MSAPASTAVRASLKRPDPADLDDHGCHSVPGPRTVLEPPSVSRPQARPDAGGRVGRGHECLRRRGSRRPHVRCANRATSCAAKMPLSATSRRSAGTRGASSMVVSSRTVKSCRFRLLMPISRCPARQSDVQFRRWSGPRPARPCRAPRPGCARSARSRCVQRGDDQQDGVCAGRPRLVDLVRVAHEVLAQERRVRQGCPHSVQVVEGTAGSTLRRSAR